MDLDVDFFGELAAQVFDVNSCASIHIRRIFTGEQGGSQRRLQSAFSTVSRGVFTAYKKGPERRNNRANKRRISVDVANLGGFQ
jgi:hypothetical protein